MIYQEFLLSVYAISWFSERFYYYCIHEKNNKTSDGLLNLNAPLAPSYAQYNPITIPDTSNESNSQLNDTENQSHL